MDDLNKKLNSQAVDSDITGPTLTRRQFLATSSAVASSVVAAPLLASAADLADKRLDLTWATDEETGARVLDVTIIQSHREADGSACDDSPEYRHNVTWRIRPESFGPRAELIYRAPNGRRTWEELRITRVSYGRLRERQIIFRFAKDKDKANGPRDRFVISAEISIWSSKSRPTKSIKIELEAESKNELWRNGVFLQEFIEPKNPAQLQHSISVKSAANTFALVFNGLIRCTPEFTARTVQIFFSADSEWKVRSTGGALAALGNRIRLNEVSFFWPINQDRIKQSKEAPLYGKGELFEDGKSNLSFSIGGSQGPGIQLLNKGTTGDILFRSQIPNDKERKGERLIRAEANLGGKWAQIGFLEKSGFVGPIRNLYGSVLERVDGPVAESDTIYSDQAGSISFQGDYIKPEKEEKYTTLETPIGPIIAVPLRAKILETEIFDGKFPERDGWPITALYTWRSKSYENPRTEFIEASVAMVEAGIALPNAKYSRLTFDDTELRVFYSRKALDRPPLGSFIQLSSSTANEFARIDLARAGLKASQSHHLLSLLFRFSDLALSFYQNQVEFVSYNTQCDIETRPGQTLDDLKPHDTRPVLVVEFPPQHLFEEARFFPTRPPLLDVSLAKPKLTIKRDDGDIIKDEVFQDGESQVYKETEKEIILDSDNRGHVVDALRTLKRGGTKNDKEFRRLLRLKKSNQHSTFKKLADKVAPKLARLVKLPYDQVHYIGPFALDVDAMRVVRSTFDEIRSDAIESEVVNLFKSIKQVRDDIGIKPAELLTLDLALEAETVTQGSVPMYLQFRNFYRDSMVGFAMGEQQPHIKLKKADWPTIASPEEIEFLHAVIDKKPSKFNTALRNRRYKKVREAFKNELMGREDLGAASRGRLANPSRLSFRVNCRDGLDAVRLEYPYLDSPSDGEERLPRGQITFDLNSLVSFRGMELAVTRRAEVVYDPGQLGQISSQVPRLADTSIAAMLDHLSFTRGSEVSVSTRLAEVAASLSPPTQLETAIEIPSRLILSPNQNAVVLTPNANPVPEIFDLEISPDCISTTGQTPKRNRLWAASFVTDADGYGFNPGIRAVYSPDLRPAALLSRFADKSRKEGEGELVETQPPGGPYDPWFVSRTQSESGGMTEQQLQVLGYSCSAVIDPEEVRTLPIIVRRFCEQLAGRKNKPGKLSLKFRNSIDNRSRHQLVLLSSGWGLPVTGRRDSSFSLTEGSSQAEPVEGYKLWDLLPGNAIYEPRPLEVTELSLTALGGTLRHDTAFEPPTGAKFWRDRLSVFDAFTVERWQQWTNLGRDIYTEVVHKGFLFPLGIRASLVQVTERIFYLNKLTGVITTPLRQRMFIRVANPNKVFPALKQPFGGRRFPVRALKLLTTTTPDIVDPYSEEATKGGPAASSGRLKFDRGLVFWPRIFKSTLGNVRFEMDVDGVKTNLPLLFVDNTAVDHSSTLRDIVKYYNGTLVPSPDEEVSDTSSTPKRLQPVDPATHIKTLVFNGAERRYGPELESGSATYQTDHWTLRATGGFRGVAKVSTTQFSLDTSDYFFGSLRQGADQPPFYPAIDTARIYLTQAEQLTGQDFGTVRVHFDARYVVHGFRPKDETNMNPVENAPLVNNQNPNEIMLVIRDQRQLSMNDKGDQSGGVFQPEGYIVALSRLKGAMTQSGRFALDSPGRETDFLHDVAGLFKFDLEDPDSSAISKFWLSDSITLMKETGTMVIESLDIASEAKEKYRQIYEKFFSDNAKILGLVSIKDLIKYINPSRLSSPDEGLPELSEKTEFGTALANDSAALVRERVVRPLATAARNVREVWNQLESNLAGSTGSVIKISDVFPELDQSLRDLTFALNKAESETDPVLFNLQLGACYTSGQRFLTAVQRAAANPGKAIQENLSKRYTEALTFFRRLEDRFGNDLVDLISNSTAFPTEDAISEIVSEFVPDSASPLSREILLLPRSSGTYEVGGTIDSVKLEEFKVCLDELLPASGDVRAILKSLVKFVYAEFISKGGLPRPSIEDLLDDYLLVGASIEFPRKNGLNSPVTLLKKMRLALSNAKEKIILVLPNDQHSEIERLVANIQDNLENQKKGIVHWVDGQLQFNEGSNAQQIRNRYFACVLLNFASKPADAERYAKKFNPKFLREFLKFLAGLQLGETHLSARFKFELSPVMEALRDAIDAVWDFFNGLQDGNFPDILDALGRLFDNFGLSLPDFNLDAGTFCTYFDPVWKILQGVMQELADVGEVTRICPSAWVRPTVATIDGPGGDSLLNSYARNPTLVDALPGGHDPSLCKALLLIASHAEGLRVQVSSGTLITAVEKVKEQTDKLVSNGAPVPPEARVQVTKLKEGTEETQSCLISLRDSARELYSLTMEDSSALASTIRDLDAARKLEPCSGRLDLNVLESLKSLVNLPRDFKALGERRKRLIDSIHAQMITLIKKLQDIEKAQRGENDWIAILPIAVATTKHLKTIGLLQDDGSPADWVANDSEMNSRVNELAQALSNSEKQIKQFLEPVIDAACRSIDVISRALDRLEGAEKHVSEKLEEIDGKLTELNNPTLQSFAGRVRREINLADVRQKLVEANQRHANLRKMGKKLCQLVSDGMVNTLDDINVLAEGGKNPFDIYQSGTLSDVAALQRDVSAKLTRVSNELRPLLEFNGRDAVRKAFDKPVENILSSSGGDNYVASTYIDLVSWRNELYDVLKDAPIFGGEIADRLLKKPDSTRGEIGTSGFKYSPFRTGKSGVTLNKENDQLAGDAKWLQLLDAKKAPEQGQDYGGPVSNPHLSAYLFEFVQEWSKGESTPLLILQEIAELVEDVLSGQLFRHIDFNALREEFEDHLLSLVPTKVRRGYGFNIHLGQEVEKATGGIFRPGPETALGIDMKVEIDLLPLAQNGDPKVDFLSIGTLGPFDVKLVGDFFDALTLQFASARFESKSGEKPKFDIAYKGYEIGPQLEFVEKLQKYLAPKDGSGAILRFDPSQPGVEAGYRMQLGDFSVGTLAFSNVGLETSAILPFSDGEALFRASLSSRASPFTLTIAPYGGSGHFGILANVEGIIGFEAGFEFGGSAVFAFGPLSGKGRLMSGIYIRQLKIDKYRLTEISATFFVGGSASIWIFNFGAALSVKLGMVDGGSMTGEATFSFSFSMGLVDYDYSVRMKKQEGKGFSGESQAKAGTTKEQGEPILVASLGLPVGSVGDSSQSQFYKNKYGARLVSDAKCQSQSWRTYRSYFEDSARPEEYF